MKEVEALASLLLLTPHKQNLSDTLVIIREHDFNLATTRFLKFINGDIHKVPDGTLWEIIKLHGKTLTAVCAWYQPKFPKGPQRPTSISA